MSNNSKSFVTIVLACVFIVSLLWGLVACSKAAYSSDDVDVALILVVDISGSIDAAEYELQKNGIVSAFMDKSVKLAIKNGAIGKIKVSIIEFASGVYITVPWMTLSTSDEVDDFANRYATAQRPPVGTETNIKKGMELANAYMNECACTPIKKVVDVSGDGTDSYGNSGAIRDTMVDNGIIINGLVIMDEKNVDVYYMKYVIGGPGHFLKTINKFEDFLESIRQKIILEIS